MENFSIVALDPGGTTGWARYVADRLQVDEGAYGYEYYNSKWECGQLGPGEHHSDLWALLELGRVESYTIVTESFEYRNRARPGLELMSKEYIGIAKLFGQINGVEVLEQTASMGKGFVRDENIKRLGLWHPGWKHAMDAYRHLLYYIVNNARIDRTKLLSMGWTNHGDNK